MPYINLANDVKQDRSDALNAAIGANAKLLIFTGLPPLTPDEAPTGVLLASLDCSAVFGAPTVGVTVIVVEDGGTGYTSLPTVVVTGGGGGGVTATAILEGGVVVEIIVTGFGSGFTSIPDVAITGGGGAGADVRAEINPVLTANAIASSLSLASGEAGFARIEDAGGNGIVDMDMTAPGGGGSIIINTTTIAVGGPVQVTSLQIGEQ